MILQKLTTPGGGRALESSAAKPTNDKLSILHGLNTFENKGKIFRNNTAPHPREADRSRITLWEHENFQTEVNP